MGAKQLQIEAIVTFQNFCIICYRNIALFSSNIHEIKTNIYKFFQSKKYDCVSKTNIKNNSKSDPIYSLDNVYSV